MKNRKKYTIPVKERYQSVLDEKKRRVLNYISCVTCIISLLSAIQLLRISDRTFNLTPAAITLYACELIMLVSMILTVHMEHQKEQIVSYHVLMWSYGALMIAGLAGLLFGLVAFQRPPVSMKLLWICCISAGVTGICSAVVYTSYQKVKK